MEAIKKTTRSLIIAVIFSLILHIVVIASISGIDLFSFKELFATKPFEAKIVSELPKKHNLNKIKESPLVRPDSTPRSDDKEQKTEDRQLQAKPLEEDTIKTEQPPENPPVDNTQAQDNESKIQQTASLPASEKPVESPKTQDTIQILKSAREKLYFDIYWLGIYVGKAVLEATNDNGKVKITSLVHSAPFISTFYTVDDYAESRVINGIPSYFKIKQHEGRKRSDKETFFDTDNKRVIHVNHIKGTKDEHSLNADMVWDVMSGFYYLRTQQLDIGKTLYINIFDSNKFYKAEVQVLRKDRIMTDDNKELDTVVVKPILKSEGLFDNKGNIFVWLSDDNLKLPVRVETEVPIGKVVAKLKEIETEK